MLIKPKNVESLLRFLKSKPLILYGIGGIGIRISKWCDQHGIEYLFSDKDLAKLQNFPKKSVITPQNIVKEYADAIIIVSSLVYEKEITDDLLHLGIAKEKIFSCSLFMPDEVSWEEIEENQLTDWTHMQKRYEMISEWGWIANEMKTVADYGSGHKFIKAYLSSSVKYYPIDYIDRGDSTIICDFNKKEFPDICTEFSICTGVLMYIEPAEELIAHICKHTTRTVLFSYVAIEKFSNIQARRCLSYHNDYTEPQIVNMFSTYQFELNDKKYERAGNITMTFFLFEKSGDIK